MWFGWIVNEINQDTSHDVQNVSISPSTHLFLTWCIHRGSWRKSRSERFLHQVHWSYEMNRGRKFPPFGNERTDPTLQYEQGRAVQVVLAHTDRVGWENKRCQSILNSDILHRDHVIPSSSCQLKLGLRLIVSYEEASEFADTTLNWSLHTKPVSCVQTASHQQIVSDSFFTCQTLWYPKYRIVNMYPYQFQRVPETLHRIVIKVEQVLVTNKLCEPTHTIGRVNLSRIGYNSR